MIDHHNEYRHGLAADQRIQHAPPTASDRGWDFAPRPRPRIVPMALTYLAGVMTFVLPLIAWCVL